MFMHLGANVLVESSQVITIIDAKMLETAKSLEEFLQVQEEEGFVIDIEPGNTKSYVVTNSNVYFSPISTLTLKKRMFYMEQL